MDPFHVEADDGGRDYDLRALGFLYLGGEVVDRELIEATERDRALHAILELADVAWPVVVDEQPVGREIPRTGFLLRRAIWSMKC
jgi:hypothetical protein